MPTYSLWYFDFRGRAEVPRLILKEAGIDFEDKRIAFEDWFQKLKPTMPFNQIPVLFVDGTPLAESGAIVRFLARECGLAGQTSLEEAHVDALHETLDEFFFKLPLLEDDPAVKEQKTKEIMDKNVTPALTKIEDHLKKTGNEYLIGKGLTYADLSLMNTALNMKAHGSPLDPEQYPCITALAERIANRDAIKKWLKERPETRI